MTFNRCVHCATPLPTNGASEWWCDDTCMQGWTTTQNRAKCEWPTPAAMAAMPVAAPPPAVLLPVRVGDGTQPLPDLPASAYPPDAVPLELAPVPRRPRWLDRILGWR